jgi:hypothetical protein
MRRWLLLPLCAAVLSTGCDGDSAPQQTPMHFEKKARAVKQGPTPEELTAGMIEAVTVGKSTVPVGLKFEVPSRPVVGQPVPIVIAVMPQVVGSATLRVSGSEGLNFPSDGNDVDMAAIDPAQAYKVVIPTTPTAEGVQLMGVNLTLTHDEVTETRTFSVPLIVAAASN